jgi:hypothetical protein
MLSRPIQSLNVLLLCCYFCSCVRSQDQKLIAQTIWLFDRWWKFPAPNRWLFGKLLFRADMLTIHSPDNLNIARQMFPEVRSELVLFGIRAEEKIAPTNAAIP